MTSQKTIERCRNRVKELESENLALKESNVTLLANNVALKQKLESLKTDSDHMKETIHAIEQVNTDLQKQRNDCKQKCEIALKQKDEALAIYQRKAANTKTLSDIKWGHRMEGSKIILTGELP